MTQRTSQKLADALRLKGFEDLAKRAEADEFHDFKSPHAFPELTLAAILEGLCRDQSLTADQRNGARAIRHDLIEGTFDADNAESEEWAASPEGQDAFQRLARGE